MAMVCSGQLVAHILVYSKLVCCVKARNENNRSMQYCSGSFTKVADKGFVKNTYDCSIGRSMVTSFDFIQKG